MCKLLSMLPLISIGYFALIVLALSPGTFAACPPERSNDLCCINVAPFSTNSAVWGSICGLVPTSQSELIGARCISWPASGW